MFIIEKGTPPQKEVERTCDRCKTKFSFEGIDTIKPGVRCEYVFCPVCGDAIDLDDLNSKEQNALKELY